MELQGINSIFGFLILILNVFRINAQILPEPLVQHNNRSSVCYGQGTHGQFRPSCPDNESVIAVQELRVGTKPIEANCPVSVTKWTNHTGSYIVDHSDFSKILDESSCCLPDESQDCTFVYSYLNSGLDNEYHIYSSGYSESKPDMEVSWGKTSCNNSYYPIGTNYMYMDYSCIKRTKICDMCSNSIYTTVDGVLYLYNTNYPNSVKATIKFCQCDIQSDATNIQIYSIDMRLETDGHECKQAIDLTDSLGTTHLDCESAPAFDVTKWSKNREVTITFSNDLLVDGGYVWIGVFGARDDTVTIHCTYQDKQDTVDSTSPAHSTTIQGLTGGNRSTTAQTTSVGQDSTEDTTTEQESTLIPMTPTEQESTTSTGGTISNPQSVVSERTSSSESTQSQILTNTESTIFTDVPTRSQSLTSTTAKNTLSTSEMSSATNTAITDLQTSHKELISTSEEHAPVPTTENTVGPSEPTSEDTHTRSIPITPTPQEMSDHYTIVVEDSQGTPIIVLIVICAFIVLLLLAMFLIKCGYPCRTNRRIDIEPGDVSDIQNRTNNAHGIEPGDVSGRRTGANIGHGIEPGDVSGRRTGANIGHGIEPRDVSGRRTGANIGYGIEPRDVSGRRTGANIAHSCEPRDVSDRWTGANIAHGSEPMNVSNRRTGANRVEPENTTQDTGAHFNERTLVETETEISNLTTTRNEDENISEASECSSPGQCSIFDSTFLDDITLVQGNEDIENAEVKDAENIIQFEQGDDKNIRDSKRATKRTFGSNERSNSKTAQQKSMKRAASPNKGKKKKRQRSKSNKKK